MISVLICVLSIVLVILGISTFVNKIKRMKNFFYSISKAYSELLNSQGSYIKLLLKTIIALNIFGMILVSYNKSMIITDEVFGLKVIIFTIILSAFVFFCIYFLFGIPLLVISKISELVISIKNSKISIKLVVSFMLIIIYALFLWVAKKEMIKYSFIIFSGLAMSYILNIEMLITVIMNPLCFFTDSDQIIETDTDKKSILRITLTACFVLLIIILVNLFLWVLMISYVDNGAYYCSIVGHKIHTFDLFYYTIISFTTIGYGDIVPNTFQSQLMAVMIALTSVLCLGIFIGSALSVKDKLKDKLKNECDKELESVGEDLIEELNLIEARRLHEEIIQCIKSKENKLVNQEEDTIASQSIKLMKIKLNTMEEGIDTTKTSINLVLMDDLKTHINQLKEDITKASVENSERGDLIKPFKNLVKNLNFEKKINLLYEKVTNISNETNLLSLNASIEAAKAGNYGKTFSIVASEIRKLSNNSKNIASEIKELSTYTTLSINDIIENIESMIKVYENYNKFSEIFEGSNKISKDIKNCCDLFDSYNSELHNLSRLVKSSICIVNEQS